MIFDKYRRLLISTIFTFVISGTGIAVWAFFSDDRVSLIMAAVFILLIHILLIGYSAFCYVTTKKYNPGKTKLDYESLDRFIVKPDTWFIKRLMLFDNYGKYVGNTTLKIDNLKSLLIAGFSHHAIILPVNYEIRDYNGNLIVVFKREGLRSAVINIFDDKDNHIGKVEFNELKILLKFSGWVYTAKNKFPISTDLIFGDAESGIMTLNTFNNPVEYHQIFREMSTEVATLSETISTDTGKVALALLNIIYLLRTSGS